MPRRKPVEELFDDIEQGPMLDHYVQRADIKVTGGDTLKNSILQIEYAFTSILV